MEITLILVLIATAYILVNLYVTGKINKAFYLKEDRRALHKKLIWIIPFLGPLMIRGSWKKRKIEKLDVITKDKRKRTKSHFYESGIGQ